MNNATQSGGVPCNIALIGFMGAGKSTVSACLQNSYGMRAADTDAMIVQAQGMAIKDIFAQRGEEYFRVCESETIKSLHEVKNTVISCGGGAVVREENVRALKGFCRIVLLTATPATVLARVKDSDERPILNGHMNEEYIAALMEKRADCYRRAADIVIATDGKTAQQICEELLAKLPLTAPAAEAEQ